MQFAVLGPLAVRRAGADLDLGTPKARTLLAVLLCYPGRPVSAPFLAEALWGDEPPKSAVKNVQTYVHRLRRRLGDPERIASRGRAYLLRVDRAELDAARFRDLAAAGRTAETAGDLPGAGRLLSEALGLWRGPAFSGMSGVPVLTAEAARLTEVRLGALELRIDVDLRLGRHAALLGELTALTGEHPLRERLWAQLMLALYRSGRRADALEAYRRARHTLVEQAGLDPGAELRHLHQAILAQEDTLNPASPQHGTALAGPSGEAASSRSGAALAGPSGEAASSRSGAAPSGPSGAVPSPPEEADSTPLSPQDGEEPSSPDETAAPPPERRPPVPRMLPPALGDFTGQDMELAEITAWLSKERSPDEATPVVAVSGRGGVGKSTLAITAAHRLRPDYADGQLYAVLGGARPHDPYAVLGRFLRALGVPAAALPDDADERCGLYRSLLADRRMLVVLDDAWDEGQIASLLPGSGGCGVIVTGRARLGGLAGARLVELGELADSDGERLLHRIAGAKLGQADPQDVRSLVRACAGLPLALRIAGSLLVSRPHWRVADLVAQLGDARHRLDGLRYRDLAVRASFELSYRRLSPAARRLFRLLGLLEAPDFPAWTAAAVLDAETARAQGLLDELVDVNLLDVVTTFEARARYRFHDLIRAYARERAEAEETPEQREEALIRAFGALLALTGFVFRAQTGYDELTRGDAPRWRPGEVTGAFPPAADPLSLLAAEGPALLAAIGQAADLGLDEICWELALGTETLFQARRSLDRWENAYGPALALTETAGNKRGQAALLASLAGVHFMRRRFDLAEDCCTRAVRLFQEIGDRMGEAQALQYLPYVLVAAGRLSEAIALGLEIRGLLTELGQTSSALDVYAQVGRALLEDGRTGEAAGVLTEVVAEAEASGNRVLIVRDSYWLALARLDLGRTAEAEAAIATLSARAEVLGATGSLYAAHARGRLLLARGDHSEAGWQLSAGLEAARGHDDVLMQVRILLALSDLHAGQVEGIRHAEQALGLARDMNDAVNTARALDRLARLRAAAGDHDAAARAGREAAAIRARIG
ncbi:DNA-binding SARP family transcriptional activator [Nonomuraea fuscirosea]|uniref:DNA-binding SARP family transcriptional activator n=1 Tax=Nonomuraea fuscirosea TaxID=1291556 RepID=A0A2T0N9Z8_9ACTN|nr:AfsR/SARP family transcriptional regulator [Nonomuraea fuscirosea]PRX69608.1 DNA-binding SARP family transcriptional activator [Nonomuraea fuscirosea]